MSQKIYEIDADLSNGDSINMTVGGRNKDEAIAEFKGIIKESGKSVTKLRIEEMQPASSFDFFEDAEQEWERIHKEYPSTKKSTKKPTKKSAKKNAAKKTPKKAVKKSTEKRTPKSSSSLDAQIARIARGH